MRERARRASLATRQGTVQRKAAPNVNRSGNEPHDVEQMSEAIAAKLHAKSSVIREADDHIALDIYRKGSGYDVKLKTTI